jgi:GNAT superfamily N-acetyltransferase
VPEYELALDAFSGPSRPGTIVAMPTITRAREQDLPMLLALMRLYLDFYEVSPADADVLAMSRALLADPERHGVQLLARDADGRMSGFATVLWTWSSLRAARIATLQDLYVIAEARGTGVADALIDEARFEARAAGARRLAWRTAFDNHRAQRVYDRVGATRSEWVHYDLGVDD